MKIKISFLIIILFSTQAFVKAQIPQAINFQAIARDATGNVMDNTPIQIQLSILDNSSTGTVLYKELRAVTTNSYGSFSFQIGVDPYAVLTGNLQDINWLEGKKFLKIDYDPSNQFQFNLSLGTIEFVSVPYAFAAGSVYKIDVTNAKQNDVLKYNATTGNFEPSAGFSGDYNDLTNKPNIFSGNYSDLTYKPIIIDTILHNFSTSNSLNINTSGDWNIAFGIESLHQNSTGRTNTAIGSYTLSSNTIGSDNTAIGISALSFNIAGEGNTAIGANALDFNTTGQYNTATGIQTLVSNNGDANAALGAYSLQSNETGSFNVAIGWAALSKNKFGSYNTAVGNMADVTDASLNNATAIGGQAQVDASNKVVIGNPSVNSIGGYAPWTNYSDQRLKENIEYNDRLGLDFILKLKTVSYSYKADPIKRRRDGLIAQDVEQTLNELGLNFSGLIVDENKDKTLNLAYGEFVVPLINAVKEQNKQINDLKEQIEALKALYEKSVK